MKTDYSAERIDCDELPAPPSEIIIPDNKDAGTVAEPIVLMYAIWFAGIIAIVLFCKFVIG